MGRGNRSVFRSEVASNAFQMQQLERRELLSGLPWYAQPQYVSRGIHVNSNAQIIGVTLAPRITVPTIIGGITLVPTTVYGGGTTGAIAMGGGSVTVASGSGATGTGATGGVLNIGGCVLTLNVGAGNPTI